ncbi:MAG TPA: hypothetical protein VEC96_14945, partial [Anaerolineae bacterium]|nr:hypothetical protein [Anaerolineae bacterium]
DFKRVTSPTLQALETSATEVWGKLVKMPGRFITISTEALFGRFEAQEFPELKTWREYITSRYTWLTD